MGDVLIYLFVALFLIFSLLNLIRAKDLKIRPGIIKMDWISIALLWLIFIIFARVVKADRTDTLLMVMVATLYVVSSRIGRGIADDGVILQAGNPIMTRKYKFDDLKQVNVSNDGALAAFAIVVNNNAVDIQRYPVDKKDELVSLFKKQNVQIIYK